MHRFMDWVRGLALTLGGPGLFLIAALDSSFLSFPEVVDVMLVLMVTQHPERMVYYAGLATAGSILGCYALYRVARKGGEAFLRKRFKERHVDRAIGIFQKYGLLAVAVPAILPPPVPFKIFVLAAGVTRVRSFDFLVAVSIGRGVRYFGEGLLAIWYGEPALDFLRQHGTKMSIVLAVTLVAGATLWFFLRRRKRVLKFQGGVDARGGKPL